MRAREATVRFLWVLAAGASMAWAQADPVATGDAAALRIEIVGASVSAGFEDGPLTGGTADNRTVPLQRVVRGWLEGTGDKIASRADLAMFMDPEARGETQIARVVRSKPDLLLAIDFLFWFGYGDVQFDRQQADGEPKARMQRFELGLAMLDRIAVPIVVGDLPDVHGAAARMIRPAQIPTVELLGQLNVRLTQWAAARPRVHVFPLRDLVATMKERGVTLPLEGAPLATPPGGLMQGDRLHATRVGMAYLGFLLQEHVRAAMPKERAAAVPLRPFAAFVAAADAAVDLEDLQHKLAGTIAPTAEPVRAGGR